MTQPEELEPDEEVLAYEETAVAQVCAGLAAAVAPIVASALAAFAAGATAGALTSLVQSALRRMRWPVMTPKLREVAAGAVALGMRRAGPRVRAPRPELEVPDLDEVTRIRVRSAVDLAGDLPMETKADLNAVIGRISAVRSRAEGQVRWTANEGVNAGITAVARKLKAGVIWIPERDACLDCLAYAGWSVPAGESFPSGLTFGDKPGGQEGMRYPPLHPNCRCQVQVWRGEIGPPPRGRSAVDPAARLAAEARRSVVYGWTAHESQAATLRAMSRLLDRGAALPASVERRARDLARQGRTLDPPR